METWEEEQIEHMKDSGMSSEKIATKLLGSGHNPKECCKKERERCAKLLEDLHRDHAEGEVTVSMCSSEIVECVNKMRYGK